MFTDCVRFLHLIMIKVFILNAIPTSRASRVLLYWYSIFPVWKAPKLWLSLSVVTGWISHVAILCSLKSDIFFRLLTCHAKRSFDTGKLSRKGM